MYNASQLPPRTFNLEGIFRGFLGGDLRKPKALVLEVEQEQLAIKLPKELRSRVGEWLTLGDRLQCIGSSRIDYKAGAIKLQAYQVFVMDSAVDRALSSPSPAMTGVTTDEIRSCSIPKHAEPARTKIGHQQAKILVCHKSDCQKQGGRQLVAALEQILKNHQLEDQVQIHYTGCQKRCSQAPSLTIMPGKYRYDSLNLMDLSSLIEEHFCNVELG